MKKSGFTLVEMLLVIAIVGILITILIPSVIGVSEETKTKQAKADLRSLMSAVEQYYLKNNRYPEPVGSLETLLQAMDPRVVNEVPVDPFSKTLLEYQYAVDNFTATTGRPTYVIYSVSPDGDDSYAVTAPDVVTATDAAGAKRIYVTNAATVTP
ncbi:MAG: type II secretion system protein [Planctomycetota bacterium]